MPRRAAPSHAVEWDGRIAPAIALRCRSLGSSVVFDQQIGHGDGGDDGINFQAALSNNEETKSAPIEVERGEKMEFTSSILSVYTVSRYLYLRKNEVSPSEFLFKQK